VATMNRTAKAYALAIIGAEHVMRWLPVGTHDWRKFVKPSEMARHLRAANMRIETLTGLTYNPFTSGWSLNERDLSVNYMATATRDG
ncbi:MAG: bifunctional 3-demethylubiquinol 3-O-methyltransferase/2-polyprenyl-6-hydroxyphenol methylase, partial [Rhodospirillaceae bacterium]|nr:bifunctional 3-demethylubiquinol 3-O-methyltransferase/2-polyprenyl-6-hydroxyphenol methylase [Rhodospirillaceae bacterium]